jgi:FtsP/CotA-like multicopper oxidase with cupredoxin domain
MDLRQPEEVQLGQNPRPPQGRYPVLGCYDRRGFLRAIGGAGLAAPSVLRSSATLLGPGAALLQSGEAYSARREPLIQPSEIRSQNGVLDAALTAAPGTVQLDEVTFPGSLYNNSYLPSLLRARTGDVMRIAFKNDLPDDPSNLHFHGMGVSPRGNSDNVFVHVHPGQEFKYEVKIPARDRQGPGLFWYHPHAHGVVAKQMLGGMSGGIVIDGFEKYFSILKDLPERFLFIKHFEHADREIISINGQVNPAVAIRPGEVQFWRIAHIGATLFIKFRVEGMPLYVVATDGHPLSHPQRMTEFFVGPGQRIDAIVIGPPVGEYPMSRGLPQGSRSRTPAGRFCLWAAGGLLSCARGRPHPPTHRPSAARSVAQRLAAVQGSSPRRRLFGRHCQSWSHGGRFYELFPCH